MGWAYYCKLRVPLTSRVRKITYMGFIPLTEGSGINLDDGTLDKRVCSDKFIVGSVIHLIQESSTDNFGNITITYDTNNPSLPSDMLWTPGIISTIETKSTVLLRTSTDTNCMNTLRTKFSVGRLTTKFEFSLLAVVGTLTTGGRTFVPGRSRDTLTLQFNVSELQDAKPAALTHVGKSWGKGTVHLEVVWMCQSWIKFDGFSISDRHSPKALRNSHECSWMHGKWFLSIGYKMSCHMASCLDRLVLA